MVDNLSTLLFPDSGLNKGLNKPHEKIMCDQFAENRHMEPETAHSSQPHLEKTASEKRLFDLMKSVKDEKMRAALEEILDVEQELKQEIEQNMDCEVLDDAVTEEQVEEKKKECERIIHKIEDAFLKFDMATRERLDRPIRRPL
uniref:BMERB domain-containing protein n=1 Tax=Steinernema glaseri TaxID=37863 RepID=A0A1I8ALV7_9BILA